MGRAVLGSELTLTVEQLTYGVDALARHDQQVVFVPYGAPGDRVLARVIEARRDYQRAELMRVQVAGPDRVLPGCGYFPRCGGCQWQHVAPAAQRVAKQALVAEQLRRVAGIETPLVLPTRSAEADWHYRARLSFPIEGRRLGYHAAGSHRLVEVASCPLGESVLSTHLALLRTWVGALRVALRRVTIAAAPGGVVLVASTVTRASRVDVSVTEQLLADHAAVRGAVLTGGGTRLTVGDPRVTVQLEHDLALEVPADVFAQVNPAANRLLVATVIEWADVQPGQRVLDLYCGAGNFTLPLARRGAKVYGIERDPLAGATGADNAARLGVRDASFHTASVRDALLHPPWAPDLIVLDPPRAGAREAVPRLAALRAPRMLYVACDPATLARDVRALRTHGYELVRVQPIDLFPQTYHIESIAELRLT